MAASEEEKPPLLVVAMDFGTTFSGYAFATLDDYKTNPLLISTYTWATGSQTGMSLKTPTCILFDSDENFVAFGKDAEDIYTELANENNHKGWHYFRRFKMDLYKTGPQEMPRDLKIKDDQGRQMSAMKVFAESIKFLKNHMMGEWAKRDLQTAFKPDEIQWVLTVPAIWSDAAKQFMRESAIKGGIRNTQLILALEPEAASIYCKHIPNELTVTDGQTTIDALSPGTKYLILDAGGGTIDITVQEVQEDESIKQLYMANGGDWGGTKVDLAFEKRLEEFVGKPALHKFRQENKSGQLDLQREFELKKRTIKSDQTSKTTIRVPVSLKDAYAAVSGKELKSTHVAKLEKDKLRLAPDTATDLFAEPCAYIVSHLQKIFDDPKVKGTDTILMVGGFSESPLLQHEVKKAFPSKTIIIPPDAGLAVLKGAVQFGFDQTVISTRVCKVTYGIESSSPFDDGKDPEDKKFIDEDGDVLCRGRFSKHVEIRQSVRIDEEIKEQIYSPVSSDQTSMAVDVWTSTNKNPRYTDERGCSLHGKISVELPDSKLGVCRDVGVKMIFGKTELEVKAIVKHTGKSTAAKFDFLR
ncbi:unnamed protein product [Mytilus edulis]|uniref:Uncharacterized protein n=1 Tax=Mytilus edulis TaxID=6550 RepID=A0A8S3Q1S0_MYTED|nr:unnamed protein product [Mytilus edulis]